MKTKKHTEDCLDANDDTSVLKGKCICPKTTQHTPLDVRFYVPSGMGVPNGWKLVQTFRTEGTPNDVIRAVKSHAALLAIAKNSLRDFEIMGRRTKSEDIEMNAIRQVIANATGGDL